MVSPSTLLLSRGVDAAVRLSMTSSKNSKMCDSK
jgi:hypothetical protein